MSQPHLAVCTPWASKPEALFSKCFIDLLNAIPRPYELFIRHERPVADARNEITAAALAMPSVTHLLWIDDDMTFRPDYAARLLAHDLPVVGGLCFNRRSPYHPVLAKSWHPGSGLEEGYGWIYDPPHSGLIEVDGTGGAFLLVRREVFEKIGKGGWWDQRDDISEDLSFCRRVKEAGHQIFVDCGVEVGHLGQVVVDRAFAERNRSVEVLAWRPYHSAKTWSEPRVSIVIPTYNQELGILRAAVQSALGQTASVEVIVVDDGSEQPVAAADLTEFPDARLHIVRHANNMGISAALNTGIRAMTTPWFAWLSSDDLIDPRKVEVQLGTMEAGALKCSFHRFNTFGDPEGKTASLSPMVVWRVPDEQRALLAQACFINGSTVMIHRTVFDEVGLFDTTYRYAGDWEFWNRVAQKHLWHPIPQVLGSRREYENLTAKIERNPELARVMSEEQERIVAKYAPRCPHCSRPVTQDFVLGKAAL